jgi:hypothetical protein
MDFHPCGSESSICLLLGSRDQYRVNGLVFTPVPIVRALSFLFYVCYKIITWCKTTVPCLRVPIFVLTKNWITRLLTCSIGVAKF